MISPGFALIYRNLSLNLITQALGDSIVLFSRSGHILKNSNLDNSNPFFQSVLSQNKLHKIAGLSFLSELSQI